MFVIQHVDDKTFLHVDYSVGQHDYSELKNTFGSLDEATEFSSMSSAMDAAADYGQRWEHRYPGTNVPCLVQHRIEQVGRRIVEAL